MSSSPFHQSINQSIHVSKRLHLTTSVPEDVSSSPWPSLFLVWPSLLHRGCGSPSSPDRTFCKVQVCYHSLTCLTRGTGCGGLSRSTASPFSPGPGSSGPDCTLNPWAQWLSEARL